MYTHIRTHTHTCVYLYVYTYICMYIFMYIHTYMFMYICTDTERMRTRETEPYFSEALLQPSSRNEFNKFGN